jgi:hypothetical protein
MARPFSVVSAACLALALVAGPARAANVAVYASANLASAATGLGHTVTTVSLAQIEGGLAGYNVLVLSRAYDAGNAWSAAACTGLATFLNAGGGVVTEWDATGALFSSYAPGTYYPWPAPQCGFFAGTVGQGDPVGSGVPIAITLPGDPTMAGLTNGFSMGSGSQFFFQVTGYDPGTWTVAATYDGWGVPNNAAVLHAQYGAGKVAIAVMDYQDVLPGDANATQLFGNLLTFAAGAPALAPTITTVAPTSGFTTGGTTVVLTGTNFTGATAVTFGGVAASSFTVDSATQITATTPAHAAGAVDVAVTAPGGTATATGAFTYLVPPPTITSVSPYWGPAAGGITVTITGTNLTAPTSVTFGGVAATITGGTATSITVTLPAHPLGSVDVVVTTAGGIATLASGFLYQDASVVPTLSGWMLGLLAAALAGIGVRALKA